MNDQDRENLSADSIPEGEYSGAPHHGEAPEVSSTAARHADDPRAER